MVDLTTVKMFTARVVATSWRSTVVNMVVVVVECTGEGGGGGELGGGGGGMHG